jgi:hypothetical protein
MNSFLGVHFWTVALCVAVLVATLAIEGICSFLWRNRPIKEKEPTPELRKLRERLSKIAQCSSTQKNMAA